MPAPDETNAVECGLCGHELTKEEREYPEYRQGDLLCERCLRDKFMHTCDWCENLTDGAPEDHPAIGELMAVLEPLEGCMYCGPAVPWIRGQYRSTMMPGIYRVKKWPIYANGIIEGYLFADAFEWFAPLPKALAEHHDADYDAPCWVLCPECQWTIKHGQYHWPPERTV